VSIDTEIEGSPSSVKGVATWLRQTLATALDDAAEAASTARTSALGSWDGEAGDEFLDVARRLRAGGDDLAGAARDMAGDLDEFATSLTTCQSDMADVRSTAREAGLTVAGFVVQHPGDGPARPPEHFEGTEAEVAAHDQRVAEYNAHQDKLTAYAAAQTEASRVDRVYETACRSLQDQYTPGQHASWLLSLAEAVGEGAAAGVASQRANALRTQAQGLLDEASRAIADLQANPDRYVQRRWFFFERVDTARLEADRLAIAGKLDEAQDLLARANAAGESRLPANLGRVGKALGVIGLGLGVYNDYAEGETAPQIATSQGVSFLAGMGTGAAAGAAIGSVVPVAGTAVGAVAGTIIGAGVAIFSDGMIDSFFENGPDVGEALSEGVEALGDTASAIGDGIGGAVSAVGGWFD